MAEAAPVYERMKVTELRALLLAKQQPTNGTKAELVARLTTMSTTVLTALEITSSSTMGPKEDEKDTMEVSTDGKAGASRATRGRPKAAAVTVTQEVEVTTVTTTRKRSAPNATEEPKASSSKRSKPERAAKGSADTPEAHNNEEKTEEEGKAEAVAETMAKPKAKPKAKAKAKGTETSPTETCAAEGEDASMSTIPVAKAGAKAAADKGPTEADIFQNTVPFHRRTTDSDFDPQLHLKIISWNVNGLAALVKTAHLTNLIERERPDILCLQETKLQEEAAATVAPLLGYEMYSACSLTKLGYSGTRIYVKEGLVAEGKVQYGLQDKHKDEGRAITMELSDFFLVNTYVPNAGMELDRLDYRVKKWDCAMEAHLKELQTAKPVIWTGDLNVAERDYDRFFAGTYKTMSKCPGFTPEERSSFRAMLSALDMTDSFRHLYPTAAHAYSFWSTRFNQRAKNNGWRLDYFVVSKALEDRMVDTFMLPDVLGSDHCPIVLWLRK